MTDEARNDSCIAESADWWERANKMFIFQKKHFFALTQFTSCNNIRAEIALLAGDSREPEPADSCTLRLFVGGIDVM